MLIQTDDNLKSLRQYGTNELPLARFVDKPEKYRDFLSNWHWHNEVEIGYVKYGQVRYFFRGSEMLLSKGDAIFINSGLIHRSESSGDCELISLVFNPSFIAQRGSVVYENYLRPILSSTLEYRVFREGSEIDTNLLNQIVSLVHIEDVEGSALEIQLGTGKIWLDLYNEEKDTLKPRILKANMLTFTRLRQMVYYIMQNFAGKITLDDLAEVAKISKSEVLRCFKTGLETTPIGFLTEYRLSRASDYLRISDSSITDIAEKCGFDNSGYFCKVFKKYNGVTPNAYRKSRSHKLHHNKQEK